MEECKEAGLAKLFLFEVWIFKLLKIANNEIEIEKERSRLALD